MRKKLFWRNTLLGGLVLALGLAAGCGNNASSDLKIGMVYELTGNTATYGTSAANGAKLAFKEMHVRFPILQYPPVQVN